MADLLTLYLSQNGAEFCPPPTFDASPNYHLRLFTASVGLVLTLVANLAFVNWANAFHRKNLYKNITIILVVVAVVDICWAILASFELVHDWAYLYAMEAIKDTVFDQMDLLVEVG